MMYSLERCRFTAPLHTGHERASNRLESAEMIFRADTLFSAMTHEAIRQGCMAAWVQAVEAGHIRFSDLFPYQGEVYYLPKPICFAPERAAAPQGGDSVKKKQLKKMQVLPVADVATFIQGQDIDTDHIPAFGRMALQQRVQRPADYKEDPLPYYVGGFHFHLDCGLYAIVQGETADHVQLFRRLFHALGDTGIGGKVSTGMGRYEAATADVPAPLQAMLDNANATSQVLLSTALPTDDELPAAMDGAATLLLRRGGFVQSSTHPGQGTKRRTVFLFRSGSTFRQRFDGQLVSVGAPDGPHPVHRYAKGLFLGVTA